MYKAAGQDPCCGTLFPSPRWDQTDQTVQSDVVERCCITSCTMTDQSDYSKRSNINPI